MKLLEPMNGSCDESEDDVKEEVCTIYGYCVVRTS